MKNLKGTVIAAAVLSLTALATTNVQARGWHVGVGIAGGFVAGTIVGETIINSVPPVYYAYPQPIYPAAVCAPVVAAPRAYCYPAPVVYPDHYAPIRVGYNYVRPYHFRR